MTALIFLDTETTGLELDDDIWEFGAIRREPDGTERTLHLFIEHDWEKCRKLPESFLEDHTARFPSHDQTTSRQDAAHAIAAFLAADDEGNKPHVVGGVPNFDMERIHLFLTAYNARWRANWHYHLIDVENLAVGYLAAKGVKVDLPWDSDELSGLVGVEPPVEQRHTALGDAYWAREIYDAITGGIK